MVLTDQFFFNLQFFNDNQHQNVNSFQLSYYSKVLKQTKTELHLSGVSINIR